MAHRHRITLKPDGTAECVCGDPIQVSFTRRETIMVQCLHCLGDYDLAEVTVTQYSDVATWVTPCCGRYATDRKSPEGHQYYVEQDTDGRTLS